MSGGVGGGAPRQARRLYLGNIPVGTSQTTLASFLDSALQEMKASSRGSEPHPEGLSSVLLVTLHADKNFAFAEFRTAEDATLAVSLDGVPFHGNTLRVRRPKDYVATTGGDGSGVATGANGVGGGGGGSSDQYNRIFIGNIPAYIGEDQVKELVLTFGAVQHFHLVKDPTTGVSKGYAFCEFEDPSLAEQAIEGLHGMELGEKKLTVQRATQGGKSGSSTEGMAGGEGEGASSQGSVAGSQSEEMRPTKVLQLLNLISPDDLQDDREVEEVKEDVRSECSKYGTVQEVRIPRPHKAAPVTKEAQEAGEKPRVPGLGRVFVQFSQAMECAVALRALGGRSFGERTVLTAYCPEMAFEEERY
ncbi:MAG: U2 small nuclear ribo protein auxiliary factor 50 [Piptocephalis tieghemiana]|nr:MAG: U2 small nuclear ribo protein auxiliary factor 50 [Piptocephalis tieghemiana]